MNSYYVPLLFYFIISRSAAFFKYHFTHERYMLIVTTEYISGKNIQTLGLVSGGTIQTVNAIRDIGSGLKNLVGGELKKYNQMMSDARSLAIDRMVGEAQAMGADAIISVRFSTSSVMQSAAEVMVYGTAVKFI